MPREYGNLKTKILKLLQALEDQGYVKSKKIGPARIYFFHRSGE